MIHDKRRAISQPRCFSDLSGRYRDDRFRIAAMYRFSIVILALLHTATAGAYDRQLAKTTLAGELTECAAYFIVVSELAEQRGQPNAADGVAMTAEVLMDGSAALIGEEATEASYKAAKARHVAVLQDPSTFAVMQQRYDGPCFALFRDPGSRMQYWLDKQ